MGNCGGYDNAMAIILGQGVMQAYNYFQAWLNDKSYKITLGQYKILDIISVFEAAEESEVSRSAADAPGDAAGGPALFSEVPIGFTAYGSYNGAPPYSNLVILRGTQTDEEAFYDMDWTFKPCILNGTQYGNASTGVYNFYTKGDVITNSLERNVMLAVQKLARTASYPDWYYAAHSLGGGLITLAALDAVVSKWYGLRTPTTTVYTFASLHVGDAGFASAFAKAIPEAYRIANLADWVPALVGLEADVPGYVHVGLPVTFLWQKDADWANHSMKDTYLNAITNYASVLQCGPRKYPQ